MSRILRRPMFRGGSTNNEGIMSVPRKGYKKAGPVDSEFDFGFLGDNREEGGLRNLSSSYYGGLLEDENKSDLLGLGLSNRTSDIDIDSDKSTTLNKSKIIEKIKEGDIADELGLSPLGKRLRQRYLSQRTDPLGKFLINFGLNYMSARPRGGKFGALATAAEAAKKPTEQLYADQDTEAALELKLLSAFGKEKDTDAMKIAKAYAQKYGGTAEDYLAMIAKRKIDSSDLKDLSPAAIVRKYATEASKSRDFQDDPVAQRNIGIFRLRVEQDKVDKNILNSLAPGNPYLAPDLVKRSSENKNILEFSPTANEQDRKLYNESYIYVNPTDRGFYQIKDINKKRVFVRVGEFN